MRTDAGLERLRHSIKKLGSVIIAYSGGVDSSLVAKVAHDELGKNAVAIMVGTELIDDTEIRCAEVTAKKIGLGFALVRTSVLSDERLAISPPDRCYVCKGLILAALDQERKKRGMSYLVDGTNADDAASDRPGMKALKEAGARSPLAEVGLTKADVRRIAKKLDVPSADKPSNPCLATRIPFGERIEPRKLSKIALAEEPLKRLGFPEVRVRHHGDIARIEVPVGMLRELMRQREEVVAKVKAAGFVYVVLDLEGYRSGSMEEALGRRRKARKS